MYIIKVSDMQCTACWLQLSVGSEGCVVYRKPNAQMSYFNALEETIDGVYSIPNNVMILGDLNCNVTTNNSLSKKMTDLCSATQVTQLIKEASRITPHSSSLIDLILI